MRGAATAKRLWDPTVVTAPLQEVWGTPLSRFAHLMSLFSIAPR
jgi:hypothetical protein